MEIWEVVVVFLAAMVPSLIYLVWIRNSEIYNRERWRYVLSVYLFGMVVSIIGAVLLESVAIELLRAPGTVFSEGFWSFEPYDPTVEIVILAVIIAPLVEEWTKSWGVLAIRNRIREPEDGLIYGAAVGLGFAAMENVFYNSSALLSGFDVFLSTAVVRATTSTLLHASASAILGYGIARKYLYGVRGIKVGWLPYYLAAVLLHAMFNAFAVSGEVIEGEWVPLIGLVAASVLAIGMFLWMRGSVRSMDRE
ncbi:MAG: PrsW family intramembrane metalloprotease [Methanomassiliicoccales archaeon]|nr:PrsW family intramembrane metalloprotease [Methanomassiliicoccales archaeon]